jgi:hypothetical protein
LGKGNYAWTNFTALCEFFPMLRSLEHKGICSSMYVHDGHLHDPIARHARARHALFYTEYGPEHDEFLVLYRNTDWVFDVGCKAHACSNGVHWGLKDFSSEKILEDVHISIEALRNSATALLDSVDAFLIRHMVFETEREHLAEKELFWRIMGVDVDFFDLVMEVDPFWDGAHLRVRAELASDTKCWEKVSACVMYLLKWSKFSETRWCAVGKSARLILRSISIGLDGLVKMVLDDPVVSNYHLNGFSRSDFFARRYLAVAAFSCFPAEGVLQELLFDDRLLKRAAVFRQTLDDEVEFLLNVPPYVWTRCAACVGGDCTADNLRNWSLHATLVSCGYIYKEVFAPLEQDPLWLTQNDIDANLEKLSTRVSPIEDRTTKQIKLLLDIGYVCRHRMPHSKLCVSVCRAIFVGCGFHFETHVFGFMPCLSIVSELMCLDSVWPQ